MNKFMGKCWAQVTIEPALVITFIVTTIGYLANNNLVLQKLCYSNGTGPVLGAICPDEVNVQKEFAVIQSYKLTLSTCCKLLIIILSSTWKGSRKPFFMIPIFGHILVDSFHLWSAYYWQSSVWTLVTVSGVISGLSGEGTLLQMGSILYATDNTTPEQRTLRMGIYEGLYAFTAPIGCLFSGYLIITLGFYFVLLFTMIGNFLSIVMIYLTIKDNHLKKESSKNKSSGIGDKIKIIQDEMSSLDNCSKDIPDDLLKRTSEIVNNNNNNITTTTTTNNITNNNNKQTKTEPKKTPNKTDMDIKVHDEINPFTQCLNNFRILIRPRGDRRTTIVLLLVCAEIALHCSLKGEYNMLYLYVRATFGWTEELFGIYAAYKAWIDTLGVLLGVVVLGKVFKLQDTSLGLLACVSILLESIGYLIVKTNFLMYIVPLLDTFHILGFVAGTSILSKEVDAHELPNVLSVNRIISNCFPLITTPLYMMVYRSTVDVWPAAFFCIGVGLSIPVFISFGTVKYLHSKRRRASEEHYH